AEVFVDHLDCRPAERTSAVNEAVLPTPALMIVQQLIWGRLAHIDESSAAEVVSRDLGHRRPPSRRGGPVRFERIPPWLPPPAVPEAGRSAWSGDRPQAPSAASVPRIDPFACIAVSP